MLIMLQLNPKPIFFKQVFLCLAEFYTTAKWNFFSHFFLSFFFFPVGYFTVAFIAHIILKRSLAAGALSVNDGGFADCKNWSARHLMRC